MAMHWNPEFHTALERQYITLRDEDLSTLHQWLCHPGEKCKDGCDKAAIPERLAAMESVEDYLQLDELKQNYEV